MADLDVAGLRELLVKATGFGERPLPWKVWTSNSFRRVKTAGDRDGHDVLSAYAQRSDGHLDLSMPEDRLIALIDLLNALPGALDRLEVQEDMVLVPREPTNGMVIAGAMAVAPNVVDCPDDAPDAEVSMRDHCLAEARATYAAMLSALRCPASRWGLKCWKARIRISTMGYEQHEFQPQPSNPFSAACAKLRAAGFTLAPTNIPGLTLVNGPGVWDQELSMAQVEHFAFQLP